MIFTKIGKKEQAPISIVTPSYNQGEFIEETILSVKNQNYPKIEHIVVDGGSTDNTVEILKKYERSYNLRWVSEPDEGQADAINKGFRMARGEIVGWLNSDDVYFSRDVFSKVAFQFTKHPGVDVLYGNRVAIDGSNRLIKVQYSRKFDYAKLIKGYFAIHQETVFFCQRVIKECELNTDLYVTLDSEFWLRIGKLYKFRYIDEFFGGFRIHSENKTVADAHIQKWNEEKRYLMREYGVRRYMIGGGFPWRRISNQLKALFAGGYINYYQLPFDIIRLFSIPEEELAFPMVVYKRKFFRYLINSITPWLK